MNKKYKRISKKARRQKHTKNKVSEVKSQKRTKEETFDLLKISFSICSTLATTGINHLTILYFGVLGIHVEIILVIIFIIIASIGRRKYRNK